MKTSFLMVLLVSALTNFAHASCWLDCDSEGHKCIKRCDNSVSQTALAIDINAATIVNYSDAQSHDLSCSIH